MKDNAIYDKHGRNTYIGSVENSENVGGVLDVSVGNSLSISLLKI
jgi:hypothetical protein